MTEAETVAHIRRNLFEEWAVSRGLPVGRNKARNYANATTRIAWAAWLESRKVPAS